MIKLEMVCNSAQWAALEGLAYWKQQESYEREANGETLDAVRFSENVRESMKECEKAKIPNWLGNAVLVYAENWRNYMVSDMLHYLNKRGYSVKIERS